MMLQFLLLQPSAVWIAAVAPPALLPIQILAGVALVAVVVAFVYVLRHLKKIEQLIVADNLIPAQRGPRNNLVLIVCAVPIVLVTLLLFLLFKA